ncbi:hypothetical protein TNIN_200671 [Trichonephila inaurata madagascariensis]|uniref:Uncharacterized protein n=2 Tax=Trichonephila inaurata madagascariensis TaxID=2747483 RepID=A0A8X6X4M7_9ARAC|nr:hypothetical protein TNIN_200671 [Trichonephila inaurata madagascariensis]
MKVNPNCRSAKNFNRIILLISGLRLEGYSGISLRIKRETGCPDAEDIEPCVCTNSPFTYLECKNIRDAEDLRNVFVKSERYRYKEVHIEYSSLQYLPYNIFESVKVIELYLKNVTLTQIFDRPPEALDELRKLHIEHTKVLRGIVWELLEPLKSLRILNIYYNSVRSLGRDFSKHITKDLEQLTFYATETRTIKSGTFAEFPKLDKLAVGACNLTKLNRDIFPVPFNGGVLYFNDNQLTKIPDDLFTQMPNLQTLGIRNNRIGTIKKEALDNDGARLTYLMLDGNPLKCDCDLVWLMHSKPEVLQGSCESPKKLHGKELKDLSASDFNC